jgi:hypothetical protein
VIQFSSIIKVFIVKSHFKKGIDGYLFIDNLYPFTNGRTSEMKKLGRLCPI